MCSRRSVLHRLVIKFERIVHKDIPPIGPAGEKWPKRLKWSNCSKQSSSPRQLNTMISCCEVQHAGMVQVVEVHEPVIKSESLEYYGYYGVFFVAEVLDAAGTAQAGHDL
jgi:hypothetical protein